MRIAILSCGAVALKEEDQNWLFGAPENIRQELDKAGIEPPKVVFTTSLRAPGMGNLGPVISFKEQPFRINGIYAMPIKHKHGTDYVVDSGQAKILFSERGDVSVEDTEGYHLAIIKNKHRADRFSENVITWPWPDAEYLIKDGVITPLEITTKVWSSIDDVPANLKTIDGTALDLAQANFLARVAKDSADDGENWAIAKSAFKKAYEKKDNKWIRKNKQSKEFSKEEVNYRDATGKEMCGSCRFFLRAEKEEDAGKCQIVSGDIYYDDTCDKYVNAAEYAKKEAVEKEYEHGEPIPNFLDVLTASLHKAYNDCSDHLFKLGYLNQDERMKVAQSIGSGLSAVRSALENEEFSGRKIEKYDIDLPYVTKENLTLKSLVPGVPDKIDDYWKTVYKDNEGQERWASISSVATWDRQNELFSTKAMDWAITFSKIIGKGPLRYRHVPGLDGGDCDTQIRVGDFLFESGTFRDTSMGNRLKELMSDPDYGISLGLAYAKEDIKSGVYQRAAIFERSLTKQPAVLQTKALSYKEEDNIMTILTEAELKELSEELNMPFDDIKKLYEGALVSSNPLGLKEFKELALKANGGGALVATSDDDDEEEEPKGKKYSKKEMKDILESLSVSEFKELEGLLTEVKMDNGDHDDDDDDEEEYPMMKGKKKKEDQRLDKLETVVAQQADLLMQQTKAMNELATAIVGKQSQGKLNEAVTDFLGQVPRQQASRFVSTSVKSEEEVGDFDATILNKLKEIDEKVNSIGSAVPGAKTVYDMFTSSNLNRGKS